LFHRLVVDLHDLRQVILAGDAYSHFLQ
jgi:hypothetical protein